MLQAFFLFDVSELKIDYQINMAETDVRLK